MNESSLAHSLKTEAELHALQNQINPHFLYNTLEVLRSRALAHNADDVASMAEALGMLFRYCINSPNELATLRQELGNIRDYLLIQRYRYGERFTFTDIIADEDKYLLSYHIPVMTLQPIIENAIVHGLSNRTEGGEIRLRIESTQTKVHIIVEDNGTGMDDATLIRVRKNLFDEHFTDTDSVTDKPVSIGIQNVNRRIKYYFGSDYGVDITSTLSIGTTVIITLPRMDAV